MSDKGRKKGFLANSAGARRESVRAVAALKEMCKKEHR